MTDQLAPAKPLKRHVAVRVEQALDDTRIVAIVGPRQSGKTTLARHLGAMRGMPFVTLDDAQFRTFANEDPTGFMRDLDRAVIDEIQRAPGLILALKKIVDEDPRPGRFLITGSVDLFRGTLSPDSLAGRVETIELLPFSQGEIERRDPSLFLERAFSADFPATEETGRTPRMIERIVAGGYPEALSRANPDRRRAWLRAYGNALTQRDVIEISAISKTEEIARLLHHAAVACGQLVNLSALSSSLGIDGKTADRWLNLLEQMFVLRRIRAWHRNDLKRLVKTPKLHFLDTGLLASTRRLTVEDLRRDRTRLGSLLENFVYAELAKLTALTPDAVAISHYRDKDQSEVDFVLEQAGRIVGVEVKASATANTDDFKGLRRLKEAAGDAFVCGILLHDGERIQRTGDGLYAMPVGQLWT